MHCDELRRVKLGQNRYFCVLVTPIGSVVNFGHQGVSVFSNRNTKLCVYRAGMHIEG